MTIHAITNQKSFINYNNNNTKKPKQPMRKNLLTTILLCCTLTITAQNLQDVGVSANLAPWKTQFKAASVGYVYGDVNGDDKTDISDVVSIINAIAQNDKSNPRADVNEDGVIDISDVVKVINIMAGLDTPPISVDKSSLDMTTGETEDVKIIRVSGSGEYEVTNENPDIVSVEWLSDSSNTSTRRKVNAAGETEVEDGESFSADGFLKIFALQPGQAKITVVDKNTSKKLIVSVTVTANYNTDLFADFHPAHASYVTYSSVGCGFSVTPPWGGEMKCRITLSENPDMSEIQQTADVSFTVSEGEKTYYNQNGETVTFSDLKSDTKYYWRIAYYDSQSGTYVNGTPICWFKTPSADHDPAVDAGLCPDTHHPHIIDLGYAGKWACCNVGANAPWEYGGYYAWGETEEKEYYSWENYIHCDGSEDTCHDLGGDIAGTDYDVAHVKWGGGWRVPSYEQIITFINCYKESEWTSLNGVYGRKVTGFNGNSIFLPAAGRRWDDGNLYKDGSIGYYWSSKQSGDDEAGLCAGRSVRPIIVIDEPEPQDPADPAVEAGLCPDSNHPHVIDMGEAGKWSCCNVGASAPWEYGGYYAWGETEEKDYYDWNKYKHCDGSEETCRDLGSDIAGTDYDVAHVKWGGKWRMPSRDQQTLLLDNCSSEWTEVNGINGRKFMAPNGSTIFLPAAGDRWNVNTYSVGSVGYYCSSTQSPYHSYNASYLTFSSGYTTWGNDSRSGGLSVRPVFSEQEDNEQEEDNDPPLCPDTNHPHIIDMGEAGKWACCNVGASAPWEYGGYYAWGETEEKESYSWQNYIHCDGSEDTCHDLGEDIASTDYDVAHVKWGSKWRMPTNNKIYLLLVNCSSEWTEVNGIEGRKFTAPNGGTIFLPAAGKRWNDDTYYVGSHGDYWSSTQSPDVSSYAYRLYFGSDNAVWPCGDRRDGRSVRPVTE